MSFPQWPGLCHFNNGALGIPFSDGSTFEDLSKVTPENPPCTEVAEFCGQISIFVLHNAFEEGTVEYLLLKAI